MKRTVVAPLLALLALPAFAATPAPVAAAFRTMNATPGGWAFTQTTVENGKKTIETFDPSLPAARQWTLVLKEGRTPTAADLEEYAADLVTRAEKKKMKENAAGDDPAAAAIRPGSLRLVRESGDAAVYEFRLPVDDPDAAKLIDVMKGRLTVGKSAPHPFVLEIFAEKPISPVVSVRIDRMYTRVEYRPAVPGGPLLPYEERSQVRGKIMMLKKLDEDSVVTYSDYRNLGAASRP